MTAIDDLLRDPSYFLHRIDPLANIVTFVPTTREQLSAATFLDGRTEFSTGAEQVVRLDALLQHCPPAAAGPNRMIFHVAFCGSTLLARLLARPGKTHVLKEPNLLVDLADWKRRGADTRFAPALRMGLACLRRRWSQAEAVVIKPSNWPNNLLPDLLSDPAGMRAIAIAMEPRAYVTAALRGGRDRLTFLARTAAHLAPSLPEGEDLVQSAIAATADPIGRAVNLALVALSLQLRLLETRIACAVAEREITARPGDAARKAGEALDLGLEDADIDAAVATCGAIDAKRPGHRFSVETRSEEDAEVKRHHGRAIDAALDWGDRALG